MMEWPASGTSGEERINYATAKCSAENSIHGSKVQWTAARCLRLLRPLSSKINLLSKVQSLKNAAPSAAQDSPTKRLGARKGWSHEPKSNTVPPTVRCNPEDEKTWDSNPRPRKRVKSTYSGRARHQNVVAPDSQKYATTERQDSPCSRKQCIEDVSQHSIVKLNDSDESKDQETADPFLTGDLLTHTKQIPWKECPTAEIGRSDDTERWKLYKGIADSLHALLEATKASPTMHEGPASLFTSCLRQVPHYMIVREQELKREEPDKDIDFISDFYLELEETAVSDNWRPLCQITRSHGLRLLANAIRDRVITIRVVSNLVCLCLRQGALTEAASLIESAVDSILELNEAGPEMKEKCEEIQVLGMMKSYVHATGKQSVAFRQLTRIWSSRPDVRAFGPNLDSFLGNAIKSIGSEEPDYRACAFIDAFVNASYLEYPLDLTSVLTRLRRFGRIRRRSRFGWARSCRSTHDRFSTISGASRNSIQLSKREKLQASTPSNTTMSALLSALVISRLLQHEKATVESAIKGDRDNILEAMEITGCQLAEYECLELAGPPPVTSETNRATFCFASVIAQTMLGAQQDGFYCPEAPMTDVLARINMSDDDILLLGDLLLSTANQGQQRGYHEAFRTVETVVDAMCRRAKDFPLGSQSQSLLQSLAVTCAFAFSEDTHLPLHLEWALAVEEAVYGKCPGSAIKISLTPSATKRANHRNAYKWEEGICEWITRTPDHGPNHRVASTKSNYDIDELVDAHISPTRSSIRESVKQLGAVAQCQDAREHEANEDHGVHRLTDAPKEEAKPGDRRAETVSHSRRWPQAPGSQGKREQSCGADELDELGVAWHEHSTARVPLALTSMVQGRRPLEETCLWQGQRKSRSSGIAASREKDLRGRFRKSLLSLIDPCDSSDELEDELSF